MQFDIERPYLPAGDQPEAIAELVKGIRAVSRTRHCLA